MKLFPKISSNKLLIVYGLLGDLSKFSLYLSLALLLLENLLPGFISTHFSFFRWSILLSFLIVLISFLGKKLSLSFSENKFGIVLASFVLFYIFINLFLVNLKFTFRENLVIAFSGLAITFLFYKSFFK